MLRFLAYAILLHSTVGDWQYGYDMADTMYYDDPGVRLTKQYDSPEMDDSSFEPSGNLVVDMINNPEKIPEIKPEDYFQRDAYGKYKPTLINGNPHHVRGICKPGDRVLAKGWVKTVDLAGKAIDDTVQFLDVPGTISCTQVINLSDEPQYSGIVNFREAGIHKNYATIHFEGFLNQPISYYVKLMGQ